MHGELSYDEMARHWHGSLKAYLIGFITSLILTSLSFWCVIEQILPPETLTLTISALALTQAIIQLLFFLHLGQESRPHWGLLIFTSMLITLIIITAGSLWIMYDLNARTMPPSLMEMHHD